MLAADEKEDSASIVDSALALMPKMAVQLAGVPRGRVSPQDEMRKERPEQKALDCTGSTGGVGLVLCNGWKLSHWW